jgi:hypothetical protein
MSAYGRKPHQQVVDATDIVKELKQGSQGPKRFLLPKKLLLPLEPHTIICGKFDLRNAVIDRPLEIRDCHFEGEVDLRNCEFKQVVIFSGCTFHEKFNSGDELESHTVYRKDLICKRATFAGLMSLHGAQVEGSAHFSQAWFLNKRRSADFSASSFEKNLNCSHTKYEGEVSLRSIGCGHSALFTNAKFAGEVDLRFLKVGRDLDLTWTYWAKAAKLGQIQVSKKLLLGASCFYGDVELYDSSIGTLEVWDPNHPDRQPIKVRKRIEKNRVNDQTSIIPSVDGLKATSIIPSEDKLNDWWKKRCRSVSQELEVRLESNNEENLVYDLFPFKKGLQRDQDEAKDFVDKLLSKVKRQKKLHPTGLNLTGTTFERFHGGPSEELALRLALKLADEQDPTKFSLDPYLELTNHYLKIGDETKARDVRVRGYEALRENASKPEGRTRWTLRRRMAERLVYKPTKYGHFIWPYLLGLMAIFFVAGTIIFWPQKTLEPVPGTDYERPHEIPLVQKLFERSVYSIDLFIPALNLRYEAMWVPESRSLGGWIYATIHSIVGWILIALFVSWLTGVIKPPE